jgi:hypothetical protein
MTERIREELALLRGWWPGIEFVEAGLWLRLPEYQIPSVVWTPRVVEVALQIPPQLPGQEPYGFYARPGVTAGGAAITNYTHPTHEPPFGDQPWGKFSWAPEAWRPSARVEQGSNMVEFTRSIADRFHEGA